MATQTIAIVDAEDSSIHDEPHIEGSRITVRSIHAWVDEGGLDPETVADRYALDIAAVYHALAYYHEHPEEMRRVERERDAAIADNRERAVTGPDDLE
jgi:uncharacterized protein (DUF433 family)